MARLLVVGGRQRRGALDLDEWQAYDEARIVWVDTETGDSQVVERYVSPPDCCAKQRPAMVFKAGTLRGQNLWLVTMTEVLVWNTQSREIQQRWTHPWFNDLHHVLPLSEDRFVVADTGLDLVLELSDQGQVLRQWNVAEQPTWERFDPDVDYRQVPTTKPHASHVNFLFSIERSLWATRFHPRDAICLDSNLEPIRLEHGGPHDGVALGGTIGFTTVNGFVARCPHAIFGALASRGDEHAEAESVVWCRLLANDASDEALGWCRGLCSAGDQEAWVGFSRIRPTRFRSHLSWLKHGFQRVGLHGTRPTRIARYDLNSGRCQQEIDLEGVGLNAVFGIYPIESNPGEISR